MVDIPAYCPHCSVTFMVPNLVGGSGTAKFINSRTNCPRCGKSTNILDGAYTFADNILKSFVGPAFTVAALQAFAELLERARKQDTPFDEVQAEAEAIAPEFGDAIRKLKGSPHYLLTFVFLIILTALRNCHFDVHTDAKVDWNQVIYQATHHGEIYSPPPTPTIPFNVLARPGNTQNPQKQEQGSRTDAPSKRTERKDTDPAKD